MTERVVIPHADDAMQRVVDQVLEKLNVFLSSTDGSEDQSVTDWADPADMTAIVRGMAPAAEGHLTIDGNSDSPINATLTEKGSKALVDDFAFLLEKTVKMGHKKCLNQLFHQADTVSVLADYLVATINTSIYTYEMNPVVSVVELETIRKFHELLGWNPEKSCGTLPPGGSYSNLYGMLCARTRRFPHVTAEGWQAGDRPAIFVSQSAHYSAKKACALMGMGYNALIPVESDDLHRMKPEALRKAITDSKQQGRNGFCVIATLGTTLMGAIDPLDEIAAICQEFDLWFHVDGCLGGALMHSPTLRKRYLPGIEKADSIAYNPHKMMGITQQCSVFLTQHKQVQIDTFSTKAAYLFNADKQYDAEQYDVGDRVFQCGRRPDCLKLWLMWRYRGDDGMAAYVDLAFKRHALFNKVLSTRKDFVSVSDPSLLESSKLPTGVPCTCFWWVPEQYRGISNKAIMVSAHADPALFKAIDASTAKSKLQLMQRGSTCSPCSSPTQPEDPVGMGSPTSFILTMSKAKDWPNFWRFVANGAHSWTSQEIDAFLDEVSSECQQIYKGL